MSGSGTVTINDLTFTNCRNNNVDSNAGYGGVIISTGTGTLIINNCNFTNDYSYYNGGAICMRPTTGTGVLNVTNSNFINNTASTTSGTQIGGAVFMKNGTMNINNCSFINNSARNHAGAIGSLGGSTTVNNSYFEDNCVLSPGYGGGAIYSSKTTQGAQFSYLNVYNSYFKNNSALTQGGAISMLIGDLYMYNSSFINETSPKGGAIYMGTTAKVDLINSSFTYNNASSAGVIYVLTSTGVINLINSSFTDNNASTGGVILINSGKNINLINSTFINNIAFNTNATNSTGNRTNHTNSTTTFGQAGVLYLNTAKNVIVNGSNFINNSAYAEGGCLFIDCTNFKIINSNFTNNHARYEGGAVYVETVENIYLAYSNFINNTALRGCGLFAATPGLSNVTYCNFSFNNAKQGGGALYFGDSTFSNVTFSNFTNNTAGWGGAIGVLNGNLIVLNSSFTNNTVPSNNITYNYGGAIDLVFGNLTAKYSTFIRNTALIGGAISSDQVMNITYCVFYDNYADYGDAIFIGYDEDYKRAATLNADYNWWGYNDPFSGEDYNYLIYSYKLDNYTSYPNWVIMTLNASADTVYRYTPIKFDVTLNKYFNSSDNSTKLLADSLPTRTVYFEGDGFNPTQSLINGEASSVYTSPGYYDVFDLGATIDGETLLVSVENVVYETEIVETELETFVNGTVEVHVIDDVGDDVTTGSLNLFYDNRAIGTSYVRNGTATFKIDLAPGNYTVLAFYFPKNPYVEASQYIDLTVLSDEIDNGTVLSCDNLTENFGDGSDLTGSLTNVDGVIISDKVVTLNLTRLSDNASKLYNVTTDEYGDYYLPINLAVGEYTAQAFFAGDDEFEPCNSSIASITVNPKLKDGTVLITSDFTEYYGAGANFTGQLLDNVTGEPVIGQHIAINLTRLSNGLSKVYWATTDTDGEYQLPINLGVGDYTAECSYSGTSEYESCMVNNTITVNPLN